MTTPSPRAAQLIIASAFIKHARANHPSEFGDCRNPECWRGYRLLMRLWPDTENWFDCPPNKQSADSRLEIALAIDKALPETCWVSWAAWSIGCHTIQENEISTPCSSDETFKEHGCCYCGKHTTPEFLAEIAAEREKEQAQC